MTKIVNMATFIGHLILKTGLSHKLVKETFFHSHDQGTQTT